MSFNCYVSIIVNNYNYENYIAQAIESCLNQTYPHLEVIVVDDGSSDRSQDIIRSYGQRVRAIFQQNAGQSSTLNAGFLASKGDIIACLDADDYFLPHKIAEIVAIYETYPQIGWCFNTNKIINGSTKALIGYSLESTSKLCDFRKPLRLGYLPFYPPAASGLSFRRDTLQQMLPIPEEIGMYDRYLCWYSLSLSPGFFLDKPLSVRLVHERNFTQVSTQSQSKGIGEYGNTKAVVSSALYLRQKCPAVARFCDRKFATGFGLNWWTDYDDSANEPFVKAYLSQVTVLEKALIYMIAFYQSRPWRKGLSFRSDCVSNLPV